MTLRGRVLSAVAVLTVACAEESSQPRLPDPVTEDPAVSDSAHPALNRMVEIPSSASRMSGVLFRAAGNGSRPTVILLHGFPGHGGLRDLAEAIRRAGWNVLTFQYRGAWGSEGVFSLTHALEDAAAAVTFVRSGAGEALHRPSLDVVLVGHSMGGWIALMTAARDTTVRAVAALAAWNVGRTGQALSDPKAFANDVQDNQRVMLPLRGTSAEAVTAEVHAHAVDWDLVPQAGALRGKSVLLLAGRKDLATPPAEHHVPLESALRSQPNTQLTTEMLDADHAFTERRITLARTVVKWLATLPMSPRGDGGRQ